MFGTNKAFLPLCFHLDIYVYLYLPICVTFRRRGNESLKWILLVTKSETVRELCRRSISASSTTKKCQFITISGSCFTWVVENAGIVIDFLGGSDHPLQKQWEDLSQGSLITDCGSDICDPSNWIHIIIINEHLHRFPLLPTSWGDVAGCPHKARKSRICDVRCWHCYNLCCYFSYVILKPVVSQS